MFLTNLNLFGERRDMKYLKRIGLLASSALLVAGCGSDSDSSAGAAGGIYNSELVAVPLFVSSAVDEELAETFGVVNESGAAAFMTSDRSIILWGSVNASVPAAPDASGNVIAPIGGSFEVYDWDEIEQEYLRAGSAFINTEAWVDGEPEDFCGFEELEDGVDPVSSLRAYVDIDGDEPEITQKEFCAEVTFDDIASTPVVGGVEADADLELYGDDWSLAALESDSFDEWCDESSSTGLCIEVDENGVVSGDWEDCVISGQFSQPFADQGHNAFDFAGGDVCEGGDSGGFSGRAFIAGEEDVIAIFLRGDGGAAYLELTYQDNPVP